MELPNWSAVWVKTREMPEITTKIIKREEWGALPPKGGIDPLPTPVEYMGYSCNKEITWNKCENMQDCSKICRLMQKKHMEEGLPDIKYNFMIGNDGNVYEGRGWNKRPQIYYERPKRKSLNSLIDVTYIGIQELKQRTEYHTNMFEWLCKYGVKNQYVYLDYGHISTNRTRILKDLMHAMGLPICYVVANYIPESMFGVFDALVKMGKKDKLIKEDCTERDFCDTLELGCRGEKDKFESDEEEEEEEEEE